MSVSSLLDKLLIYESDSDSFFSTIVVYGSDRVPQNARARYNAV